MKKSYEKGLGGSVLSADICLLSSLLKVREVSEATKLSRSSIYKMVGDGTFPPADKAWCQVRCMGVSCNS